jgi:hypothetical protein
MAIPISKNNVLRLDVIFESITERFRIFQSSPILIFLLQKQMLRSLAVVCQIKLRIIAISIVTDKVF